MSVLAIQRTQAEFLNQFLSLPEAIKDFPDEKEREKVGHYLFNARQESIQNDSDSRWPVPVDMKVIVPGLAHYEDLQNSTGESVGGNVLVQKDALDRMAKSIEGKPIINWDHRAVSPSDFKKGRAQGIIVGPAIFNAADGWYHAKGYVWDEATRRNIENGYSISCAYTVSEWGDGPGTHNQVPYEREVLNGNYTHIAVVPVPRYEGARIELLNSGGKSMGLLSFFRKDKAEEKIEVEIDKAKVAIEGLGDVPMETLVNSYKQAEELKNAHAKAAAESLRDEDFVEVNGKKVTVLELKNTHLAMYKNAEDAKLKEDHEKGEHKNSLSNCAMCNAADDEGKKKDDEEKSRKDKDERENSVKLAEKEKAEAAARAAELSELRNKGGKVEMPKITSLKDRMAEGQERYGEKPVSVTK